MLLNSKAPYQNVKEPSPNSKVWRYMNFAKFLHLITFSKLFFVRMDKLTDQLEGTLTSSGVNEIEDRYNNIEFPLSKQERKIRSNKEIADMENFNKYTLVNCWAQSADESFALWKIYLGNQPNGIAIKTKYKNLKDSIIDDKFNFLFQKVYYSAEVRDNKMSSVQFRKNRFYKFENEVRIAIFSQYIKFGGEPKYKIGTDVDVNLNKLIECIYVSPFAPVWFYDLVNYLIKEKFNYNFPIIKSKIKEK